MDGGMIECACMRCGHAAVAPSGTNHLSTCDQAVSASFRTKNTPAATPATTILQSSCLLMVVLPDHPAFVHQQTGDPLMQPTGTLPLYINTIMWRNSQKENRRAWHCNHGRWHHLEQWH